MKNGYEEVIEVERFNLFLNGKKGGSKLLIPILLLLVEELTKDRNFKKYIFEVIAFGYMGYYPAIGVQYTDNTCTKIEDEILKKIDEIINNYSLKKYIESTINNLDKIYKISKEIDEYNESYAKYYKEVLEPNLLKLRNNIKFNDNDV